MRALVIVCIALLGCDDRMSVSPLVMQDRVVDIVVPDPQVTRIDILYVLDRSPAFAPYRDTVARALGDAGTDLTTFPGYVDLHVGVVTTDLDSGDAGALLRSPLVEGPFIALRQTPVTVQTNVEGTVTAALPALADVGQVGSDRAQPLEAMRIALADNPNNAGFLRPDAWLFVIFIAAQVDTSPGTLADYAAFLHGLKSDDHSYVFVADEDPRLRDFAQLFPNREQVLGLDSSVLFDLGEETYDYLHPWGPTAGGSLCFDSLLFDTDPDRDGVQPDCAVTERTPGSEALMQPCGDGDALPCWRIARDPQECPFFQQLDLTIERGDLEPPDGGHVEAQCVGQ